LYVPGPRVNRKPLSVKTTSSIVNRPRPVHRTVSARDQHTTPREPEQRALSKGALDLADVDGGIEREAHVHHDVGPQHREVTCTRSQPSVTLSGTVAVVTTPVSVSTSTTAKAAPQLRMRETPSSTKHAGASALVVVERPANPSLKVESRQIWRGIEA
jgi:hypothetical protein